MRGGPVRPGAQTVRAQGEWSRPVLRRGYTDLQPRGQGAVRGLEGAMEGLSLGTAPGRREQEEQGRSQREQEEQYSHSRISAIQSRPLPPPVGEPIYHSPVKPPPSKPVRSGVGTSRPPQGPSGSGTSRPLQGSSGLGTTPQ